MNRLMKACVVYAVLAAAAFGVDQVYGLFGHGIRSAYMSSMWVALLVGGALLFLLLWWRTPSLPQRIGYRLMLNLHGSGMATLVTGMLLKGVVEIAGGSSDIVRGFFYAGYAFLAAALAILALLLRKVLRKPQRGKNEETDKMLEELIFDTPRAD